MPEQVRTLSGLDFVLFLEIERRGGGGHDQSMAGPPLFSRFHGMNSFMLKKENRQTHPY
jgi:hypothetical protein